jgi:DNA polymerase III delta subunit
LSNLKLVLIIDKSQSYINFQKDTILKEWGVESEDLKKVSGLSQVGSSTLFGKAPTALLELTDINSVKDFLKSLTDLNASNSVESSLGEGLIVMSDVSRQSTKKLETLVAELGGSVIIAKPGASEKMSVGEKLVNDLGFTREVKRYILDYVGDDYEALIPIVRGLSDLPKKSHSSVTVEDIYMRLPKAPGSVPPWEIERPLFAGDLTKAIDIFRRVHQNSSLLIVLSILKNKMDLSYRSAAILWDEPSKSSAGIASSLGVQDNYPLKLAIGHAKKYGIIKLQKISELMAETERKVKGGSATPGDVTMELMLVEFQRILRS